MLCFDSVQEASQMSSFFSRFFCEEFRIRLAGISPTLFVRLIVLFLFFRSTNIRCFVFSSHSTVSCKHKNFCFVVRSIIQCHEGMFLFLAWFCLAYFVGGVCLGSSVFIFLFFPFCLSAREV